MPQSPVDAAAPVSNGAGVRFHIVTGKGGTGKTTTAAALAVALARQAHKVLLVEVEGRQGIAQTFDVSPLSTDERQLFADPSGGSLWGLSVEPKAALLEYLQKFYKLGRTGALLERVGAIDFATTIAQSTPRTWSGCWPRCSRWRDSTRRRSGDHGQGRRAR